ncbi:hypothetical protein [Ensifer canadensis]|uniref:hypothetical protein n=1 Tax=Ensifer sp. Root127 TaxID=1736440 RepID=UPI00307CFF63
MNGNSRLIYFAQTILEAQQTTLRRVAFYLDKAQFYDRFRGQFNERQEKAVARGQDTRQDLISQLERDVREHP